MSRENPVCELEGERESYKIFISRSSSLFLIPQRHYLPLPQMNVEPTFLFVGQKVTDLVIHLSADLLRPERFQSDVGARDGGTDNARMETRVFPKRNILLI